jgi:hypothetical protein
VDIGGGGVEGEREVFLEEGRRVLSRKQDCPDIKSVFFSLAWPSSGAVVWSLLSYDLESKVMDAWSTRQHH